MNNQDMPANPSTNWEDCEELESQSDGETKREKAFWQVFTAMAAIKSDGRYFDDFDDTAKIALDAVNAGFKALDAKD